MPLLIRFNPLQLVSAVILLATAVMADERAADRVEFNRDIRPILSNFCFQCHGPDPSHRKADLRLDLESDAVSRLPEGRHAIVAGQPEVSELILRITSTDAESKMPPPEFDRPLSPEQISLLRRWIEQGAKWEKHWSFVNPVQVRPPDVTATDWPVSPVDSFVLSKLEQEGLTGSTAADKSTLLRRVTFDLTGLPPSVDELNSFINDTAPDAFERLVDRLLASPRYGERMAVRWLNGARYADTSGYQSDGERTMWRWRDWVIDAFNHNRRFDEFTIEQLAGDLLPNASLEQRIATGFNRNHRGNAEGGIIPEEFAVEYVVDRVETTSTVWLGLTAMCARCHNHKFDPITQSDFYQLYAFFNNLPEKGRAVKFGNSPPSLLSPTRDQQAELDRLDQQLAAAQSSWTAIQKNMATAQSAWERTVSPEAGAADAVRRGMILHFPFDGDCTPIVSVPLMPNRPDGYLGQTRLLATIPPQGAGKHKASGEPQFTTGRFGQGLDGDGQHYAAVGDVANFGFFDPFSISCWIRPSGTEGGTIISRMTDVLHGDGWCIVLQEGKLQVHLTKRWLDDACRIESAVPLELNGWHQITVTYDGSRETAGLRIYFDGLPQPTVTLLDELNQSFDNKGPLRIGAGNGAEGRFRGVIDDVRIFDRAVTSEEAQILAVPDSIAEILQSNGEQRSGPQRAALRAYFVQFAAEESVRSAWKRLNDVRDERARFVEQLPTTMVMQELPTPRDAHILIRGEYDKRGDRVSAGVPASLPPMSANAPQNRLGLAQWLVSPENPLTARVAVNRMWQMLFGVGLVKSIDDFGQQGEWPSHPELLDWLSVEFRDGPPTNRTDDPSNSPSTERGHSAASNWDVKHLLRRIVTNSTYRQSSRATQELLRRDPENRWMARGPRFRLSAEMIRDAALAVSGLLVEQLGGPSVKPYQPEGLWKDLAGLEYEQDHGQSLYRRSLYTYWKRTVAPPAMIAFDAVGRETCIVKEARTNTPLQALNLMNDVTYVEAARVLAEQIMKKGGTTTPEDRIREAFLVTLCRVPNPEELSILKAGYLRHLTYYQANTKDAETVANSGEYLRQSGLDPSELAALTTVTGLILNLDEAVTRE